MNELVLALFAAGIGYVVGLLRDRGKSKADREARYQEQVLEAAASLLQHAKQVRKTAASLGFATNRTGQAQATDTYPTDEAEAEAITAAHEEWINAVTDHWDAEEQAAPFALRISILAPTIAPLADAVLRTASEPEIGMGSPRAQELNQAHSDAQQALITAVRDYLKVPRPWRQWRRSTR